MGRREDHVRQRSGQSRGRGQGIHFKNIQSVKMLPPGPHCDQTEIM